MSLFAPWRLDYIQSVADGPKDCFLCTAARTPECDTAAFVLARGQHCLLMLNKYPYVNGHMLVAPYRHEAALGVLTPAERGEMMELLVHAQGLLTRAMNPHGFNMGINLGHCAGAGLPGHVHAHIVPRWSGDINFISIVGDVRIVPQAMDQLYAELVKMRDEMGIAPME